MGEYTANNLFYLPSLGAYGTSEKTLYDDTLKSTDAIIKELINAHNCVTPEDYGAVGDFDPSNPTAATDDLAALQAAFAANRIVYLGGKSYGVSNTLALTSDAIIVSNGGSLHRIPQDKGAVLEVLTVSGSGTEFIYVLNSDAVEGTNRIECAALASVVSRGSLIKIKSDKEYPTTVGGATFLYAGEMQTVLYVDGDYIYLSHQLEDSYTTGENARVAIISPVTLTVIGGLGIYCYPTDDLYYDEDDDDWYGQKTYGMRLIYNINSTGEFHFDGCTRHSLYVNSCYACDIRMYARNSYYENANNAYGLSIGNSTMYSTFHGVITGCRHCVMTGGANADYGISYGNKFSGQVSGISAEQVLDSHAGTGSMTYENVIVNGGTANYNQTGGPYAAGGIEMGARRNYIRNVVYQGAGPAAVSTRTVSPDIEVFDVDGLQIIGSPSYAVLIGTTNSDTKIGRLSIRNVFGDCQYGINFRGPEAEVITPGPDPPRELDLSSRTEVDELYISDVHIHGNLLLFLAYDTSRVLLPDTVRFSRCSIDSVSENSAVYIYPVVETGYSAPVKNLIFESCDFNGHEYIATVLADLDSLQFINCRAEGTTNSHQIVVGNESLAAGASIDKLVFFGGSYKFENDEDSLSLCKIDYSTPATPVEHIGCLYLDGNVYTPSEYIISAVTNSWLGDSYIGAYDAPDLTKVCNLDKSGEVTGTVTIPSYGVTLLNSSGGTVTATLPDGHYYGQEKIVIMNDSTTNSTLTVEEHETSSPEVFTFNRKGDALVLRWQGKAWWTVSNNGVTT